MHVIVQVHRSARDDLAAWVEEHAADDEEREALIHLYLEELRRVLTERRGEVPEALCYRDREPRVYWWRYTGNLWVRFLVKNDWQLWIPPHVRRVILTGFQAAPPPGVGE